MGQRYDRYEISKFMDDLGKRGFDFCSDNIANSIGCNSAFDKECWHRLSVLVNPSICISEVYMWAFTNLEGCDEAEFTLYNNILGAISDYYKSDSNMNNNNENDDGDKDNDNDENEW